MIQGNSLVVLLLQPLILEQRLARQALTECELRPLELCSDFTGLNA